MLLSWSATLTGTTFNGQRINTTSSSSTNFVTFNEPNGTYIYNTHLLSGYRSKSSKGSISVTGSSITSRINVEQTTDYLLYGGIIGVIVIIAIVGAVFAIRNRKNKP